MVLPLKGRKSSSSSKKATRHDDNLFGTDTVEVLLALGEGPFKGWKRGAADFYVGDVPLLDAASSTPNISNFELRLLKGTEPADSIRLNLGGTASTKNIGLELRTQGQIINAQLDKTQIDYIDFRFLVQRLLSANDEGGEFATDISFKIEVKRRSSAEWTIAFDNEIPPDEDTSGASSYRPGVTTPGSVVNGAYRETYIQSVAPTAGKAVGAMWFNTGLQNWRPAIWNGSGWVEPSNLSSELRGGLPVWTWVDFDGAVRSAWFSEGGIVPPPGTLAAGDFLITPQSGEQIYSYNATAWVGFQSWATPAVVAPGVISFNGLTRSAYPKEYRVAVPRINEPYDVRVTRLTPASTKNVFADIQFESIQEVNRDVVSYPNLAIAWLTIKATDTFTSIPDFTSVAQGLVIPVPTNCFFNEETKLDEYVGLWDGSFKMAYTNSPGWHAYNFIMNARYGKNSYYPEVADRWDFYNFARHCVQNKIRFNEYITEARPLNELINYIVGTAGGRYIDRGDGYSSVLWDADDQPAVAIFAPENTVEGSFTYSFTDVTERKNDFKVSFKNPELNYREDRLRVYDQNSIDIYGRNAEEFVAVGCRDHEEAVRRGRLRLATALTECIIVNFKTNRLGRYLTPFQVILVADDQSTNVISGRVLSPDTIPAGTTVLPLRDQVYFEAGVSYNVSFTLSDGNGGLKVVTYPLIQASGQQTVLRLQRALSEPLPEWAVFSIGSPKAFRITSIVEADDDKDNIDITAIEINRQKWSFVRGEVELRDILAVQTGPLSKYVYPVTGARIVPEITLDGHYNLVVMWNPSETKLIRGYRLYQSVNNGPMNLLAEPSDTRYTIPDARTGTYVVSIVAVGLDGTTESPPVTVQYIVSGTGAFRSVAPPTNLRLVNEPQSPIFHAIDPQFAWDPAQDPLVSRYLVEVLGSTAVVHSERVDGLDFMYPLTANRADNGGTPLRQFTVRVRSIDNAGNLSAPVALVVSHPAPAAVIPSLATANSALLISFDPGDPDYQGALTFIETASIPVPPLTAPKFDNKNPTLFYPAQTGQRYYVRVALYDSYGKTGLNYSEEKSIVVRDMLIDTLAPVIPDAPVVTSELVKTKDGKVSTTVKAVWTKNPSSNFGSFDTRARLRGTGDWVYYPRADDLTQTWEGQPVATLFEVQVRAWNLDHFAVSGWSPTGSTVTKANDQPPGNITGFQVTAGFQNAFLRWVNPPDSDLGYIEIYSSSSSDPATRVKVATVAAPASSWQDPTLNAGGGQRYYWVRPFNTSDIGAVQFAGPQAAVSPLIIAEQLAQGIILDTLEAEQLEAIGVPGSLPPVSGYAGPSTISYQGKLWTIQNGAWTPTVTALGAGGKLTSAQILSIDAAIVAGTFTADTIAKLSGIKQSQLATLDLAKMGGQILATHISDDLITAPMIKSGEILTEHLSAGSVTTSKIAISSANRIYNAELVNGLSGWVLGTASDGVTSNMRVRPAAETAYAPDGFLAVELSRPGTTPAGSAYAEMYLCNALPNKANENYAVAAGVRYEFSVAASVHRCIMQVSIQWFNAAGSRLGTSGPSGTNVATNGSNGGTVRNFPRSSIFATAPANAVSCRPTIRMLFTGESDPYIFASAPMLAAVTADQTEFSPYTAATLTVIDGGRLLTDSVTARVIAAGSVTTSHLLVSSTNLFFNANGKMLKADGYQSGVLLGPGNSASTLWTGNRTDQTYPGTTPYLIRPGSNNPTAGSTGTMYFRRPDALIKPSPSQNDPVGLYPVVAGQRYEVSAYLATFDARGSLQVTYHDTAGTDLTGSLGRAYSSPTVGLTNTGGPVRTGGFFTVPAGVAYVGVNVVAVWSGAGGLNPHVFASALMFAPCSALQAELSPFVVDGVTQIDGATLITGTVRGDRIEANSIDTAQLRVGAVKADQIDVKAVSADKLGVGLGIGNLIWNSDFALEEWMGYTINNAEGPGVFDYESTYAVPGFKAFRMRVPGRDVGTQPYFEFNYPTGNKAPSDKTNLLQIQGGKTYEFSAYVATRRMNAVLVIYFLDKAGTVVKQTNSQTMASNFATGVARDNWRARQTAQAPTNAVNAILRLVGTTTGAGGGTSGTDGAIVHLSCPYFGIVPDGTPEHYGEDGPNGVYSPYAPMSRTVITGGQIATNSIIAKDSIQAGSITTELMTTNAIDAKVINTVTLATQILNAKVIRSGEILVGNAGGETLNSIFNGSANIKLSGGMLSANSIETNKLKIGSRGVSSVDIEFYAERYGAQAAAELEGKLSNKIKWTSGHFLWTNNNGEQLSTFFLNGEKLIDSGYWYFYWNPDEDYTDPTYGRRGTIRAVAGDWGSAKNNGNNLLVATTSEFTGLTVHMGGTIIDGTKITTLSITADQIAANTIGADKIQANTIFAQDIYIGLKKKTDGVTVGTIALQGSTGRIVVNSHDNSTGTPRVVIGDLSAWRPYVPSSPGSTTYVKPYGLMVWNEKDEVIFSSGGVPKEALTGFTSTGNVLVNATGELGTIGWDNAGSVGGSTFGLRDPGDTYNIQGGRTFYGTASTPYGYMQYASRNQDGTRILALPGQRWEASAYVNTHRCQFQVYLRFYDYAGNDIGGTQTGRGDPTNIGAGNYISQYVRPGVFATAPAGTEYVDIIIRAWGLGPDYPNPYLFMCRPYLGQITPNQNELSPWSPGVQPFAITATNISTYIQGALIEAAYIKDLTVGSAKIANLTVGNGKIATNAVTTHASASKVGDGSTSQTSVAVGINLRPGSKVLVIAQMSGRGGVSVLAPGSGFFSTGTFRVDVDTDGQSTQTLSDQYCPVSTTYQPSDGGNKYYCPAFSFSFIWTVPTIEASTRFIFTARYSSSLINNGLNIFVMELSK